MIRNTISETHSGTRSEAFPVRISWKIAWLPASCLFVEQARKLVAERPGDRPLFLVTSFYAPHAPLFPPSRYIDHFLATDLQPAAIGDWEVAPPRESFENNVDAARVNLEDEELRRTLAGYYGLVAQIDDRIGELVPEFKQMSEGDGRPWLIIFTADHGDMMGDHYLIRKCEPYEGSARIPFLVQGSGDLGFVAGTKCDSPVCLVSFVASLPPFGMASLSSKTRQSSRQSLIMAYFAIL